MTSTTPPPTRYSGTDTTMGLALAAMGFLFPFFSPLIGWLGVALTGGDTSSNILFGNLQQVAAQQLGLSPVLRSVFWHSLVLAALMGLFVMAQAYLLPGMVLRK